MQRLITEITQRDMLVFCFWCQVLGQDRETFFAQIQDMEAGCTKPYLTQDPCLMSTPTADGEGHFAMIAASLW